VYFDRFRKEVVKSFMHTEDASVLLHMYMWSVVSTVKWYHGQSAKSSLP
jgi:hypothetical protein